MNYVKCFGIAVLFVLVGLGAVGGCNGSGDGGEDFGEDFIDDSPPPEEVVEDVNVTTPDLLTPVNNDAVPQNNPNIDCPFNPFRGYGYEIFFDWTDSDSPNGISGYRLLVMNLNALIPLIDMFVEDSELTFTSCNSFLIDSNLDDWMWSVQAEDNQGNLSDVAAGLFMFEPCRLDDGSHCSAPASPTGPVANVTAPVLLTPVNNEAIPQNDPNIDCPFDPFYSYGHEIFFDWTDSSSPNGISGYHLFVIHTGAIFPIVDTFVLDSEYTNTSCNSYIADMNLNDWIWSVQAEDNFGNLSPVVEDVFRFEPCRLENGAYCGAP